MPPNQLTIMTGHRSLAETYANEVLSDVQDAAISVSAVEMKGKIKHTCFRVVFHGLSSCEVNG